MSLSNRLPVLAQVCGLVTYVALSWWLIATVGQAAFYAYLVLFILIGLVWFALAMKMKAAHDAGRIPKPLVPLAVAFGVVGYAYDVIVLNWLVKPVLFFDYPREFPLTHYLQRILRENLQVTALDRYRVRMAKAICTQLHRYDPGHCD